VERGHGIGHRKVGQVLVLDHLQDDRGGPELQVGRHLAHVGVADDHVEPPVLVGIGVGLVARVDDRSLERRLQAHFGLEEVRPLAELVAMAVPVVRRCLPSQLAGPRVDLPGDQERGQVPHDDAERRAPIDQEVLVGTVRVPLAVAVVLVDRDALAWRKDVVELGQRSLEHALPCLVVDDQLARAGALRRGVLRVRVVHVIPSAVRQDHIGQAEVLLRGLPDLHRLEAAGVAER
jgi:hypothetical protein